MYQAWHEEGYRDSRTAARQSVARGERLFNTRPISIEGVAGLNDDLGVATIPGTCSTCHDSPNLGHHSVAAPLNIGLVDESRRTADLPLYTFRCLANGKEYKVTDPGRAMITGKCSDIGRFKGPILRGLASRAPYFHNGSAATIEEAVEFYDMRFHLGLSDEEKNDLVAFLRTL
jgi:cytochrome c peroxidase